MGPVSGDKNMVARTKIALALALNAETRRTGEEEDPLVMSLAMGSVRRCKLTSRDDTLDAQIVSREYFGENLDVCARWNGFE
jgi:hypothetical protein